MHNKQIVKHILFESFFWVMLYLTFVKHIEGAKNVVIYLVWVKAVIASYSHTDDGQEVLIKKGRVFPFYISYLIDFLILILLIWKGYFITGIVYLFMATMFDTAWRKAEYTKKINSEDAY